MQENQSSTKSDFELGKLSYTEQERSKIRQEYNKASQEYIKARNAYCDTLITPELLARVATEETRIGWAAVIIIILIVVYFVSSCILSSQLMNSSHKLLEQSKTDRFYNQVHNSTLIDNAN